MGTIYRVDWFETGDVIDRMDWLENVAELASEFNGYLDRDNVPENCIDEDRIVDNAFTTFYSDPRTAAFTVDTTTIVYHGVDQSGVILNTKTIDAKHDGVFICSWGGTWAQTGWAGTLDAICISFIMDVDGVTVAETGWMSLFRDLDSNSLYGCAPVAAGVHTVNVRARVASLPVTATPDIIAVSLETGGAMVVTVDERELFIKERTR